MASKKEDKSTEESSVSQELKKMKKKMTLMVLLIVVVLIASVGALFMMNKKGSDSESKDTPVIGTMLKDIVPEEGSITYRRDLPSHTYMISNGGIRLEASLIFYNKECANLYNDITDKKAQSKTEPTFGDADSLGDKIVKNKITLVLQSESKANLKSTEYLSNKLLETINESFVEKYGEELVKEVLITGHVVQ